jgi:hypothetical protein
VSDADDASTPLRELVIDTGADAVILGSEALELLAKCQELLNERPRLRVLTVSADGREAHLYGFRPYELVEHEFSPRFVLEAVSTPGIEELA